MDTLLAPEALGSVQDARDLAAYLMSPERRMPVLVISTAAGESRPYVDVDQLKDDVAGLAEVRIIPTGGISWEFSHSVPEGTQVYGGASRVYPVGREWLDNRYASPLRFAYGPDTQGRVRDTLVSDAMRMALAAGLIGHPSTARSHPEAAGTVAGIVGGRALVRLESGDIATVWPELVSRDVPVERLLGEGMAVRGRLDPQTRRLDVSGMRQSRDTALERYAVGRHVLVRVTRVERGHAEVELFPGVTTVVQAFDVAGRADADVRALLTVGEVLATVVRDVPDGTGKWHLNVTDGDPESTLAAPAVLEGGPSWLVLTEPDETDLLDVPPAPATSPPEPVPVETRPKEAVSAPPTPARPALPTPGDLFPRPGTPGRRASAPEPEKTPVPDEDGEAHSVAVDPGGLEAFERERTALLDLLRESEERIVKLERARDRLRTQFRQSQNELVQAQRQRAQLEENQQRVAHDDALFLDPVEQLRFEVDLEWARRIPAAEKAERPLRDYVVGPEFLPSWGGVEGVSPTKVVETIVDIVTERVHELPGRQLHQLRSGSGGGDPVVVRPADGAACWRVSLQVNSPSARRLHFWRLPDGRVELSAVRLHDDVHP